MKKRTAETKWMINKNAVIRTAPVQKNHHGGRQLLSHLVTAGRHRVILALRSERTEIIGHSVVPRERENTPFHVTLCASAPAWESWSLEAPPLRRSLTASLPVRARPSSTWRAGRFHPGPFPLLVSDLVLWNGAWLRWSGGKGCVLRRLSFLCRDGIEVYLWN